jgi:hypothetical protein
VVPQKWLVRTLTSGPASVEIGMDGGKRRNASDRCRETKNCRAHPMKVAADLLIVMKIR